MAHPSDDEHRRAARLRAVRPDGTPVYRHELRPGAPAVTVRHSRHRDASTDLPAQPHAHDFLVLVFVEDGHGTVSIDGVDQRLHAGDVLALQPGRVVAPSAESDHGRSWTASFTPDAIPALGSVSPLAWTHEPLLALFASGAGRGIVPEPDRPRWSSWFTELAAELEEPGRLGAHDAVSALMTRILVASARLAPSAPPALDALTARVFDQIEATFQQPVSAGDVATALGYTPGHLTTALRQRTGRTLLDWITERRMTEVRRLLRETDLPLGAIAARTGLRDATYLVRRFKNRYGITPQRWRRDVSGRPRPGSSSP